MLVHFLLGLSCFSSSTYIHVYIVEVHRKLTERNLQSIECKEAYNLAKSGKAILLDARESEDFEKVFCYFFLYMFATFESFFSNIELLCTGTCRKCKKCTTF